MALQGTVVQLGNLWPDLGLVGVNVDKQESYGVVLDREVKGGQQFLCIGQDKFTLLEQLSLTGMINLTYNGQ